MNFNNFYLFSNKMTDKITVKTQSGFHQVPRERLRRYPYYQEMLENPEITEIEIQEDDYERLMLDIVFNTVTVKTESGLHQIPKERLNRYLDNPDELQGFRKPREIEMSDDDLQRILNDIKNDTITIKTEYSRFEVPRKKLLMYPYFQSILEDPEVKEIELPKLDFEDALINILTKDNYEDDFYQPSLYTALEYLNTLTYLGQDITQYQQWILDIISFDGKTLPIKDISEHIDTLIRFKIVSRVANIYQEDLTYYIDDTVGIPKKNKIHIIEFKHLTETEIQTLLRMIPYMSSFARAFTICDMYALDFNLITAVPLIQDTILYEYCHQNFYANIKTESVCLIYKVFQQKLLKFLSYFDYVYSALVFNQESKNRTDGYPSFEQRNFYIDVSKNINEEWKFDTERNQLNHGYGLPVGMGFYLYGNVHVSSLPSEITNRTNLFDIVTQNINADRAEGQYEEKVAPFSQRYSRLRQSIEDSQIDTLRVQNPRMQIVKFEQKGEFYIPGDLGKKMNGGLPSITQFPGLPPMGNFGLPQFPSFGLPQSFSSSQLPSPQRSSSSYQLPSPQRSSSPVEFHLPSINSESSSPTRFPQP